MVNEQVLEQVKKFKYLGRWMTDDGRCECEIKNQIEIARSTFIEFERCVYLTEITFSDQKTSGKVLCTFTLLYASEPWTLNKQMEDKINAFEMWIFRRIFKISHFD